MPDITVGCVPEEVVRSLSGLELIQGIVMGKYPRPPILQSLDFAFDEIESGAAAFSGMAKREHYNPLGRVQGGWITALMDASMGCAIHTMLPAGSGYTTLELKINFIRPLTEKTGRVRAQGRAIHVGARTAMAESRLVDGQGKLLAHGTSTCLIFPL